MRARVVFPEPGRAVEDHRRHAVLLDREPQCAARADDVLLAGELVEGRRPQALRQRRGRAEPPPGCLAEEVAHGRKYAPAGMSDVWGAGTYERLAARFAPVQDELVDALRDRRRATACSTWRRAPARSPCGSPSAAPPSLASTSPSRCSTRPARRAEEEGVDDRVRPRRRRSTCRTTTTRSTCVVVELRADLRARPRERRRGARARHAARRTARLHRVEAEPEAR